MPFAFNINLLIGSAPRTLPIRFSMTTTMLFFVIASLLASDPIISAPGAVCFAMDPPDAAADGHAASRSPRSCGLPTRSASPLRPPRRAVTKARRLRCFSGDLHPVCDRLILHCQSTRAPTLDGGVSSCGGMLCLHTTDISQRTCPRRPGANGVYGP